MRTGLARTFASLAVPNYRRYFLGQLVSITGTWMQTVAEMWLMVELTGNGLAVGATAALQFLPMLLFGAWAGVLADRMPKRRLLMITQVLSIVPPLLLWAVTAGGSVETWMVYALVCARGTVNAVDNPARHSFAIELVGTDRVVNAVSLTSVLIHGCSIVGPAIAGVVIAVAGVEQCFLLNSLTFVVMLVALRSLDEATLRTPPLARRGGIDELRAGLRIVAGTPSLRIPLAVTAVIGTLSFNFPVILPLLARFTWDGDSTTFAAMTIAMGAGSVTGALVTGARARVGVRMVVGAAAAVGIADLLVAGAPYLAVTLLFLALLGGAGVMFAASVSSLLQLAIDPGMRGRVMALYAVVFLGSRTFGGPLVGWIAEAADPRTALAASGIGALAATAVAANAFRRSEPTLAAGGNDGI